jgi:hypothetical protein
VLSACYILSCADRYTNKTKPLEITAVVSRGFAGSAVAREILLGSHPWDYALYRSLFVGICGVILGVLVGNAPREGTR